jgi:Family of unknown function (DUF5996)
VSDEQVEAVITRTLETTPKDATHWPTRSLAAEPGLVTVDGVAGLGAFGLQPQRQDLWKLSRNPLFIDKVRDVVGLDLDVRGLTTRRLRHHRTTFEITIDFIDHALIVRTTDGPTRSFELGSGSPTSTPASTRRSPSWASTSTSPKSRSASR